METNQRGHAFNTCLALSIATNAVARSCLAAAAIFDDMVLLLLLL